MREGAWSLVLLVLFSACDKKASPQIGDRIPDIPVSQQRTVTRREFGWKWPLTVGVGTLGCISDAVVFRAGGVTYGLNLTATSRGFAPLDPIWATQSSGPREPLKRLTQDQRMRIFAEASACEKARPPNQGQCQQRILDTHHLSEPELQQIDAEGRERSWPPLSPMRRSVTPLVDAGLTLCTR
ncbi:MAG: YebY family protein [Acidobacteria bacterium]|nr:YebY family protein [Acidobacteriota bacterium]